MRRPCLPFLIALLMLITICLPTWSTMALAESTDAQLTEADNATSEPEPDGVTTEPATGDVTTTSEDSQPLPFSDGWTPEDSGSKDSAPVALFLTNILKAEDGLGTYRYTLALPTDDPLNESDPQYAAMGTLIRRLIDLDGSLGDPEDASPLADVAATVDAGFVDAYSVYLNNGAIHIYLNGEETLAEPVSAHFTGVTYTKNGRGVPSLRYTRKDGTTALIPFSPSCVALFTGSYEQLSFSSMMAGMPVVLGGGCMVDKLRADARVIMHNSGLVKDSEYSPDGITMIGIAYDEENNPITLDSGMWVTGPRPARGRICPVCGKEYNGLIESQRELHEIHVCENPNCKYGGFWASCAPEGSLYNPALHGPSPNCPYGLCFVCSDTLCPLCQRDKEMQEEQQQEGQQQEDQEVSGSQLPPIVTDP